jgi:hypothetical protein
VNFEPSCARSNTSGSGGSVAGISTAGRLAALLGEIAQTPAAATQKQTIAPS